jgi:hypothetical protein
MKSRWGDQRLLFAVASDLLPRSAKCCSGKPHQATPITDRY